MSDINQWFVTGNLGQDPELRFTQGGFPILGLRVASGYRKKVDGEYRDETEWVSVTVLGKRGEGLAKFLTKGMKVAVSGRAETRSWEAKDGTKRYTTELLADEVVVMGRGGGGGERRDYPEAAGGGNAPGDHFGDDDGDNVPF